MLTSDFRVFINLGLKNVGAEYSQQAIEDELEFMESFYGPDVSTLRAQIRDYAEIQRVFQPMVFSQSAKATISTLLLSPFPSTRSSILDWQAIVTLSAQRSTETELGRICLSLSTSLGLMELRSLSVEV